MTLFGWGSGKDMKGVEERKLWSAYIVGNDNECKRKIPLGNLIV